MPRQRRKNLILEDEAQQTAMTSPVRLEILEHLCVIGPATVRDIAARMDRTPHATHYHVRRLAEAGLIEQTSTRKSGPRDEALYDVVAERYEFAETPDEGIGAHERQTVRAVLRRAERDFTALADTDPERLGGREGFTGRMRARLSTGARDDVMKHVRAIQRIFTEEFRRDHPPQARVETYTCTIVVLPEA
ncbi:MAG: HVO_A0114 family putative DNA-binding protein [Planctomycetota bacterium]|jgi:DNA-binding MarR family transcriptional regulator